MVGIALEVQNTDARSLSKREQNLVDKIRQKHSVVRQKNAAINNPVHRNEFKRSFQEGYTRNGLLLKIMFS